MQLVRKILFIENLAFWTRRLAHTPKTQGEEFEKRIKHRHQAFWNDPKYVLSKRPYEPAPKCFSEMLGKARILSRSYEIFARIDFYATAKSVVFGEFTPTPFLGKHFTQAGESMLVAHWDKLCCGKI